MIIQRPWLVALALAFVGWTLADAVVAQQPQPRAKSAKAAAPAAAGSSDSQLRGRVEHLEEQLADMQVVVGTLEFAGPRW